MQTCPPPCGAAACVAPMWPPPTVQKAAQALGDTLASSLPVAKRLCLDPNKDGDTSKVYDCLACGRSAVWNSVVTFKNHLLTCMAGDCAIAKPKQGQDATAATGTGMDETVR